MPYKDPRNPKALAMRKWYNHTEEVKASKRNYRASNLAWAKSILGDKCVECGATELEDNGGRSNLEFDHINPKEVDFRIAGNAALSRKRLLPEIMKCQLLCRDCHRRKTLLDLGWNEAKHGTTNMYGNHKCRCSLCRDAWAEGHRSYIKEYRIKKRLRKIVSKFVIISMCARII